MLSIWLLKILVLQICGCSRADTAATDVRSDFEFLSYAGQVNALSFSTFSYCNHPDAVCYLQFELEKSQFEAGLNMCLCFCGLNNVKMF